MCKAKDVGPRCSSNGRLRVDRAEKYTTRIEAKRDSEIAKNGKISANTARQLDNAERRMYQAKKVFYATPKGQEELQDKVNIEEHRLSNLKPNSKEHKLTKRKINKLNAQMNQGQTDRKIMYANGQILEPGEKRDGRNKMRYQGAEVNERAQKCSPETAAQQKDLSKDVPLDIKPWEREQVKDLAPHWVETGTRTGWEENKNARPSKEHAGATKVIPTVSNSFRMNMPDGMVAEQRTDMHVLKNKSGGYTVEVRRTSAATNLQSSPIDTNGADLGTLIASKRGIMERRVKVVSETFKTEKEALAFATKQKRSLSQTAAVDLAVRTRQSYVNWASKGNGQEPLQKSGQPGTHLYSADASKPINTPNRDAK